MRKCAKTEIFFKSTFDLPPFHFHNSTDDMQGGALDFGNANPMDLQPQSWEDAFNLTTIATHDNGFGAITLGTWAAAECDVLAVQEVRICKEQVPTIRAILKEYGYNFFHGALPQVKMQGQQKRSLHVDQLVPGTAFLVREHIPIHEAPIELMSEWYNRGRILSLNAFINNRWIRIISGYAPVQDSNSFLDELASALHEMAHFDVIFFGDINQDAKEGMFVKEMQNYGWLPLTMCTAHDFTTYLHPKGGQSTIDTIIISDSLQDMVSPLQSQQILDKGHKMIYASIFVEDQQKPAWETSYTGKMNFETPYADRWQHALEEYIGNAGNTTIDQDWSLWCHTFQTLYNPQGSIIGDAPAFRIRDLYRKNKLIAQLGQAIRNGNWHEHDKIVHKIKRISQNQIRKWQKRISPKQQHVHEWARNLFRWARDPQPPIPSCIASDRFGYEGYTTSLHDSLREIADFFQEVYKSCEGPDHEVTQDASYVHRDNDVGDIFAATKAVIAKSNPNRVAGLDGLEVAHLKQLPDEAIEYIAHIFAKALGTKQVPKSWLNCRMSCIPKKPGRTSVKDLRPLTIAPVIYRIFCKVLLTINQNKQKNVPEDSVGGVIGRSAHHAWLPATMRCEATWKSCRQDRKFIQGVAIDTEKFFDNVPPDKACEALLGIGIPINVVATWQYMIKGIRRFASLNGAVSTDHFGTTLGIPQGDPLSMLAAAALLGQWTCDIPREDIFHKVFVDDRLMLSNCNQTLLNAFHATELWDERIGFRTRAKTCAFGNNAEDANLWWMDATEVERCKIVTYLGVPLPLRGISAQAFYEPIIQKALNTITRICRAKLTHQNAVAIISRKILPAICYPAAVVRPTKAQINLLKSRIFAAAAHRPCQTMIAHSLFCEKTHQFDPECALIYQNIRFWRRVFVNDCDLREEFSQSLIDALPIKPLLYGPVNIFQKDIEWLGCTFLTDDGELSHPTLGKLSLLEPDKKMLEHKLREMIRHKLMNVLSRKHDKWNGVTDADMEATTKLLRELDPDSPIRVPLIRLLSDAHATPHRLHKMGVIATPHCPYCLCADADITHIVWDCPRFQAMRHDWPQEMIQRAGWQTCCSHAMICTKAIDFAQKHRWPEYQLHVSKLLAQWMEFQRNRELYEPFAVKQVPSCDEPIPNLDCREACAQKCQHVNATPLHLTWLPPCTRTAINLWGATLQDYNYIFSFWTKTTTEPDESLTCLSTWTQALAIFIQLGGNGAPFLARCRNLTMAVFKFKVLSYNLLKNQPGFAKLVEELDEDTEATKWLTIFPKEAPFPRRIKITANWDLTDAAANIHLLHLQLRTDLCVHAQAIRLLTVDFEQAIPKFDCCLRADPLSGKWPTPKLAHKSIVPPWVARVYQLRLQARPANEPITCVMQLHLDEWMKLSPESLRTKIPGQPGIKKRFLAASRRFGHFKNVLLNFWQMQLLGNTKRTHIVAPAWCENEACHFCGKLLQFSTRPRIIASPCPSSCDISPDLFKMWCLQFDDFLAKLLSILDSL